MCLFRVADQPEVEEQPPKPITQKEAVAMEQDNEPTNEEMQVADEMEVDQDATTKPEVPTAQASPVKPTVKATPPPPSQPIRSKYASKIKQTTLQTSFAKTTVPAPKEETTTTPVKEKKADEKPKAPGAPKKPKDKPKEEEEPKKEAESEAEAPAEAPKEEEAEPEQDPEKILKKEQKRKLKELVKSKKRKDKKRKRGSKRGSEYVDDEASATDGEDEDTDAEMEKMTDVDRAFLAHEDTSDEETETDSEESGEESDSEKSKKKKHKHKRSKKEKRKKRNKASKDEMEVTEAEAEREEIANHVAEAMASVGSKASKSSKGKKAKKGDDGGEDASAGEKKSKRVCGWCEKGIEKNWQQARGELTGSGNTWVFFHEECYMPFVNKSNELRAKGEKPPTAKSKSSGKEEKKTAEKKTTEKKEDKKPKDAPAAKKPRVQLDVHKELDKFEKARDGWDRFINHIQDAVSTIDKDLIAEEISVFLKTWAEMDKGMQDIEDGKSDAKTIPGGKGLSDKYQRDLIFFYLMASEHGFKRFKQTVKKAAMAKTNGKKA